MQNINFEMKKRKRNNTCSSHHFNNNNFAYFNKAKCYIIVYKYQEIITKYYEFIL